MSSDGIVRTVTAIASPRLDRLHMQLRQITRLQWYLSQMIAQANAAGASDEDVRQALEQGIEMATLSDAYYIPTITNEHTQFTQALRMGEHQLGCCWDCGYIGPEEQSHCPKCQADYGPDNSGDFWPCTLRDVYQAFPMFIDQTTGD